MTFSGENREVRAAQAVLRGVVGVMGAVRCEPHGQNLGATSSIYSRARATSSRQRGSNGSNGSNGSWDRDY